MREQYFFFPNVPVARNEKPNIKKDHSLRRVGERARFKGGRCHSKGFAKPKRNVSFLLFFLFF